MIRRLLTAPFRMISSLFGGRRRRTTARRSTTTMPRTTY